MLRMQWANYVFGLWDKFTVNNYLRIRRTWIKKQKKTCLDKCLNPAPISWAGHKVRVLWHTLHATQAPAGDSLSGYTLDLSEASWPWCWYSRTSSRLELRMMVKELNLTLIMIWYEREAYCMYTICGGGEVQSLAKLKIELNILKFCWA